jgi:hypothetical protein
MEARRLKIAHVLRSKRFLGRQDIGSLAPGRGPAGGGNGLGAFSRARRQLQENELAALHERMFDGGQGFLLSRADGPGKREVIANSCCT